MIGEKDLTMKREIFITNKSEIEEYKKLLISSAECTKIKLQNLLNQHDGSSVLYNMKFANCGRDPFEDRDLNIIEQLNQQFTYFTSINAVEYLLEHYPEYAPFKMNLGTMSGYDIVSFDNNLIAEVFSATTPSNNRKIQSDVKRLSDSKAEVKISFYHSPIRFNGEEKLMEKYPSVKIQYIEKLNY